MAPLRAITAVAFLLFTGLMTSAQETEAGTGVGAWFLGLGEQYGVEPWIFGTIYVGAIPFFTASIAWLVRNLKRGQSTVAPFLSAAFFFVSAYLYLLIAGKNIPVWVYVFIAGMVAVGAWSTVRKVKARLSPPGRAE